MSSSFGAARGLVCVCGLAYDAFRAGLSFKQARRDIISIGTKKDGSLKYGRRHGVLGYMHEQKLLAWDQHVALCESASGKRGKGRAQRSRVGGR